MTISRGTAFFGGLAIAWLLTQIGSRKQLSVAGIDDDAGGSYVPNDAASGGDYDSNTDFVPRDGIAGLGCDAAMQGYGTMDEHDALAGLGRFKRPSIRRVAALALAPALSPLLMVAAPVAAMAAPALAPAVMGRSGTRMMPKSMQKAAPTRYVQFGRR